MRSFWLFLLLLSFDTLSSDTLFTEDFTGDLGENWLLFGDPLPVICDSMGMPPPSFDNNGDTMFSSGAISRNSFDFSGGLVLESDIYVTSNPRGAWITASLGLDFIRNRDYGIDGMDPPLLRIGYSYAGEANWRAPHLQGILVAGLRGCGADDQLSLYHCNEFLDGWHRFRIELRPDMTALFYIDSVEVFETVTPLPVEDDSLSIVIGSRSSSWGKVYHDNILIWRP